MAKLRCCPQEVGVDDSAYPNRRYIVPTHRGIDSHRTRQRSPKPDMWQLAPTAYKRAVIVTSKSEQTRERHSSYSNQKAFEPVMDITRIKPHPKKEDGSALKGRIIWADHQEVTFTSRVHLSEALYARQLGDASKVFLTIQGEVLLKQILANTVIAPANRPEDKTREVFIPATQNPNRLRGLVRYEPDTPAPASLVPTYVSMDASAGSPNPSAPGPRSPSPDWPASSVPSPQPSPDWPASPAPSRSPSLNWPTSPEYQLAPRRPTRRGLAKKGANQCGNGACTSLLEVKPQEKGGGTYKTCAYHRICNRDYTPTKGGG